VKPFRSNELLVRKLAYAIVFAVFYVYVVAQIGGFNQRFEGYRLGDWLINYSQGFVRRGLFGNLFFALWDGLQIPLVLSVTVFEAVLVGAYFYFVWRLVTSRLFDTWTLALFAFPMGFFYAVGEFRAVGLKEILLFLMLGVVYKFRNAALFSWQFGLTLLLWVVVLLTHEGMVFYSVYPMAIIYFATNSSIQRATRTLVFGGLGVLTAAIAFIWGAGKPVVVGLCANIVYGGHLNGKVCRGTVRWLGRDASDAFDYVFSHLTPNFVITYALAAIALLVVVFLAVRALDFEPRKLWWVIPAAWLNSVPLFLIATDWGRWIMIHAVCSAILILVLRLQKQSESTIKALPLKSELTFGLLWLLSWSVTLGGGIFFFPLVRF